MSLKWWEKTVEYKFVMLVAQEKKLFMAPLDGGQERAGDAIFSSDNRWVLIEFKKDVASIRSEIKKFVNYRQAHAALSSIDTHHHVVYGQESKDAIQHLQLCYQTYFSEISCNLTGLLDSGTQFDTFKNYIEQYTEFKKGPKGESGGGISMDEFALVAGVNADNSIVECLSLTEFQQQLGLKLKQEHHLSRGFDGPSR